MPRIASTNPALSTPTYFTLLPALSSSSLNSSYTVVSYLRPLVMPSTYLGTSKNKNLKREQNNFIYASSSIRPATNAESALISKHYQVRLFFPSTSATPPGF